MRTEQSEVFRGSLKGSRLVTLQDIPFAELNPSSIKVSGSEGLIQRVRSMLNRISTFIFVPESWSLSLSSRDVRVLNSSYWAFTLLSCITFFTSHWSLFLASLIPALITCHMRVARRILKKRFSLMNGVSTNGT